jgi:crotonobetaine/carnitine-CoA ligase
VMFSGYFRRPEETLAVFRNLWLHTGDLGRIDEDNFLFFVDRKKDYLRRRGENISSFELEKTFLHHEAIKDVAVHSVLSEVAEDEVKVTAVLRDGVTISEVDLCAWAVDRVPFFAMPRYIEFRDDLPRTPTGRVQKYQLRAEGKTPKTWDREAAGFSFERR